MNDIYKEQWNPRYLNYCKAHGIEDPDEMVKQDKTKYPGGVMCGYILWIGEKWSEFDKIYPETNLNGYRTKETHDLFDKLLTLKES